MNIIEDVELGVSKLSEKENSGIHCRVNVILKKPYISRWNLTNEEHIAFQELKEKGELSICQMGKGGRVVVLNRADEYEVWEWLSLTR